MTSPSLRAQLAKVVDDHVQMITWHRDSLVDEILTVLADQGVSGASIPRLCCICGKRMATGSMRRHGRCSACSRYLTRNGIERPARLWRSGEADAADDLHLDFDQAVAS